MEVNNYLRKIKIQIQKRELEKAIKGLMLYATLIKNQDCLSKSISLKERHQRLIDLERKNLIHPSSAAYLYKRINIATNKLLQSFELETVAKKDVVLNIKEKDLGKDLFLKLRTFFKKEFGTTFNVVLK